MLFVALLGCAVNTTRVGLVQAPSTLGAPVTLRTYDGELVRLRLDEDSDPIRYLARVIVKVEGPRALGGLWVQDWHVLDAGDGSGGFVGRLRAYGSRLVVEDRNTLRMLVIADGTALELREHVGHDVLLMGHVLDGETIAVAAWRLLEAPEP